VIERSQVRLPAGSLGQLGFLSLLSGCASRSGSIQGRCSNIQSFTQKCAAVSGTIVAVADLPGRRTLRSGGTNRLMVPSVRRSTVGDRAFTVAGPRVWNTLPGEITTSQSLSTFRQQLKTWLFGKSCPDIIS